MGVLPGIVIAVLGVMAAPAWAGEAEAHGEGGIPVKAVIYAALNFFLLLIILGYFLRKPIKEFFASRAALIRKDIEESQALRDQAQGKYNEYESRLAHIEKEMQELVAQLKRDGELEQGRLLAAAQGQIQSLQETSERIMQTELKRAKEELKKEAAQLAAQLAEDLVRQNITPEDQRRLVREYLDKMERLQ